MSQVQVSIQVQSCEVAGWWKIGVQKLQRFCQTGQIRCSTKEVYFCLGEPAYWSSVLYCSTLHSGGVTRGRVGDQRGYPV